MERSLFTLIPARDLSEAEGDINRSSVCHKPPPELQANCKFLLSFCESSKGEKVEALNHSGMRSHKGNKQFTFPNSQV